MNTVGWPQVGQYVDLKQRDISWQVGYVLFRNEHSLKLRFEGWQQKYDEIVHLPDDFSSGRNSKIQPFRSMTRGYSGPQKHPGTREHWKFSLEQHQHRLKKVEDFITNLRHKTPEQLIQFIRGEHYFYINFLMANTYLLSEDISEVYTYFEKHILIAKDYLQFLSAKGISWIQSNSNTMSEDLDKWERTYFECYYEIIESLFLISGLSERLSSFLKVNEKLIKNVVGICETHHNYVAEKFAQFGLVASARKLIKATEAEVSSQKSIKLPFPFVYSLIQLFMTIQRSYLLQKDSQILNQLKDELFVIVSAKFEDLQPEDLKNDIQIDREIQFVLSHIKVIFLMSSKRPLTNEWMDTIKIKINILLIRCDKLQRRLKGIHKLKEYCEISMREQDDWSEAREMWHSILTKFKCFELLFLENEHPEIFKRAIQLGHTLYKYNIIGIQDIRYIWNNSIKKLPVFVKLLHQFWQEISYFIAVSDIPAFIEIVEISSRESDQTNEQVEFFFQFMHVLGKNLSSLKTREEKNLQIYEKSLSDLIRRSIVKIREYENRENIQMLVECLSKSIVNYSNCLQISFQLYEQLRSKDSYRMALNILQQIYFHSDSVIYYPPDYFQILFQCLKMEDVTSKEVTLIIKMINDVMLMNGKTEKSVGGDIFKHISMKQMWIHFYHTSEEIKGIFYDWILSTKKYDGLDPYNYINPAFSGELKKYIFHHILLTKEFIKFDHISKREAEIVVQFIMFININKQKIEKKNYYNNYKVIYRLKQVDVIGEQLLWQLFQKCHTNELINYINRYLIILYFNYTPLISFELRKKRVALFMQKIISNIKNNTETNNISIFKPSLNLLRRVLDLTREDRKHEFIELNTSRVKIQVSYNNILYNLEVNIEEKISSIRTKIKNLLKLKDNHFKIYIAKSEELSFDLYDLSLCYLNDRIFKVVEVLPEEDTIPKIVTSYFDEQFEISLLKMLENKYICQEVFAFVNDMELKLNKHIILEIFKISLDKCFDQNEKLTKQVLCYFMLQIKVYNKLLDENVDLTTYLQDDQFKKLLSIMNNPIETSYHITNLNKLCILIHKIYKKGQIIPPSVHLPEKCLQTMNQICKLVIKSEQSLIKELPIHDLIAKIFHNCNSIIEHFIGQKKMLDFYASQKCFYSIFESLYTHYELGEIRMYMSEEVKNYLAFMGGQTSQNNTENILASLFFDEVFIKLLMNFDNEEKAKNFKGILQFYILMALFIGKMNLDLYVEFVVRIKYKGKSFFEIVMQYLHSVKRKEGHENYWQNYLCGNFVILTSIFKRSPEFINEKVVDFLIIDCLAITSGVVDQPLCRRPAAISFCFELLEQILKNNTSFDISKHIVCSLISSHKITIWRNISEWSVSMRNDGKQKYRGLINLGCICYMNSLLQQLYLIDEFRLTIVGMPSEPIEQKLQNEESQGKSDSQNSHNEFSIVQALKELFLSMQYSQQNVINPLSFARTIRSNDKKPMIKINQQMDIDEFESILFDRLEHGISSIGRDNFIKGLFGGVYAHQIISKECPHTSEREEEFISISLEVKRHIQDCFKSLVKIQTLEGENKYFCQKCDRKVKAEKMQTIKKLPPYLILCLKRFEFNFEIDAKIKINEYCQFTHQLNLKQYSQQQIIKKSKEVLMEQAQTEQQKIPDSYFDYKLRGVVVHSGSADSGHYYSFIETKQGEWYEFNDEEVTPFNLSKLPEEAFGSKDTYQEIKNRNAYLLIYQRVSQSHNDLKVKQKQIMSIPENNRIINLIRKKNRDIHKFEILFSKEYESLVGRIMLDINRINIQAEIVWFQYLVSYFLLVKIRKENMVDLVQYSKKIEKTIESSPSFCKVFLFAFLSIYILEEFFIFNPFRQKSKILASLFFTSLKHYYISIKKTNSFKSDKIFECIMQNLKLFFIVNTPVAELTTYFRKFIEYLIEQRDFEFIRHIEATWFFQKVMMDFIFSFQISKKYKEDSMVKYNNNRNSIPYKIDYISNVSLEGKPFYPIAVSECWKLIATLMKINYPAATGHTESKMSIDRKDIEDATANQVSKIRKYYFDSIKKQIQQLPNSKISNHVNEAGNYRGTYSMYAVFKELGLTHKLLDSIEHGLRDLESSKYRGFMMLLDIIVNDPQTSEMDIQRIITGLEKNHKHNDRFFLETDLMHQWIVKYATQSELFLEVLQQRREFIETMIDWINKLPAPTPEIIKKHKNPQTERLLHRYFGITVSSEQRDYEVSSARIKKQLQSILKMKLKQTIWSPPLSEDFSVGQTIEYFDMVFNEWKRAKILQNNFGQILLQRQKSQAKFYLWDDSQRVRKATDRIDLQIIVQKNSDISYQESHEQQKFKSNTEK